MLQKGTDKKICGCERELKLQKTKSNIQLHCMEQRIIICLFHSTSHYSFSVTRQTRIKVLQK